ncbi:NAD-dependent epimerase/dehydratase family protein [Chlorogloeopsis fritschii PCC 9212]|uniref:Epimerase n=1 Tax=Chlorogloeopsis fritschii PCC 6912 TaxID=211165 RepID=A0A3S0Y134_CHLFR|nr:NAD(P)-dependent oxidoreductase [Chlorogloeopsis fritschii]RUR81709.1 epimerase [Chlorogloeopsis fritschii PCC 6912]
MSKQEIELPYTKEEVGSWYINKNVNDQLIENIQELKNKKISVMGGCGQVGSHVIAKLYEFGFPIDNIYINDDLRLGKRENLPEPLRDRLDTRTHLEYSQNPQHEPDIVIFVGGRSSAPHFQNLNDVMEEIEMWRATVEWCVAKKIRLIFASTSSLCKQRPSVETQRVWPGSLYELAKLMMEEMAIQQALSNDLVVQICRFFSVYGVTEQHKNNFGNLYTQILWYAIKRKPFEVWGQTGYFAPGEQTRDIIFAPEVSRAILHLLTLPAPSPRVDDISSLTYNIGQGKPVSVREMIKQIEELVPSTMKPIILETEVPQYMKNYVIHTWGNPQKLIQSGFQPLFTNHIENLKFIIHALLNENDWYWSIVENIRIKTLKA